MREFIFSPWKLEPITAKLLAIHHVAHQQQQGKACNLRNLHAAMAEPACAPNPNSSAIASALSVHLAVRLPEALRRSTFQLDRRDAATPHMYVVLPKCTELFAIRWFVVAVVGLVWVGLGLWSKSNCKCSGFSRIEKECAKWRCEHVKVDRFFWCCEVVSSFGEELKWVCK